MIDTIYAALPYLLRGTLVTLKIAFFSSLIGFTGGTILGFLHTSSNAFIRSCVTLYVTLFRGTPMLIQVPFFYYLLPELGIELSLFATAVIAIGLNSMAYISQIVRSGITSIGKGQTEAAHVLGFSRWQTMCYILFPQAIRRVVPALLSEFITLIKDSSLASTIGVVELFKEGTIIISRTYAVIPIYCAIALIYLVLTTVLSFFASLLERKMNTYAHH
jgi:His/Glu/Gln/Arg/opine family amino acid ABC transporter permease subunit